MMFGFLSKPWNSITHSISSASSAVRNELEKDFQRVSHSQLANTVRKVENRIADEIHKDAPIVRDAFVKTFDVVKNEIVDERNMVKNVGETLYKDLRSGLSSVERDIVGIAKHGETAFALSMPLVVIGGAIGLVIVLKFI